MAIEIQLCPVSRGVCVSTCFVLELTELRLLDKITSQADKLEPLNCYFSRPHSHYIRYKEWIGMFYR